MEFREEGGKVYLYSNDKLVFTIPDDNKHIKPELCEEIIRGNILFYKGALLKPSFDDINDEFRLDALEEVISSVLSAKPDLILDGIIKDVLNQNPNHLTWHHRCFISTDYLCGKSILDARLNQHTLYISSESDLKLFMNAGDMFENIESDDYYEYQYFTPVNFANPDFNYVELSNLRCLLMKKVVEGKIKLIFSDSKLKELAFRNFLSDLLYCTARVNYYDEINNQFFEDVQEFLKILAYAKEV